MPERKAISAIHEHLKPWYVIILLLTLWCLVSALGVWNTYLLPTPWKVAGTFVSMLAKGEITEAVLVSLGRVLAGFVISFLLAFISGIAGTYLPASADYFRHIGNFFRNVPPIALISILILWFGLGETSKLIIIILASYFPMAMNIRNGLSGVDEKLIEVGRTLGFSDRKIFLRITLPAAFPDILVGMRIGLGYCYRALIGAEMFAAAAGLGYMIVFAKTMSRSDKVFIGIFLIGMIGCVSDALVLRLIRRLTPQAQEENRGASV